VESPRAVNEGPNRKSLSTEFTGLGNQHRHIESVRIGGKVQREDGEQHQTAAKKGVKKKLDGGILTPRSAPDADEKIHGKEHDFPKNKKEKKIKGYKDAHHAGIQQ